MDLTCQAIGNEEGAHNTPANDHWSLTLEFSQNTQTLLDELSHPSLEIVFLPTGAVDLDRTPVGNLTAANVILAPTISIVQRAASAKGFEIDFWKLLNWLYVTAYWISLAGFGEVAPTTAIPIDYSYERNFSTSIRHPTQNNVFLNRTLYEIYTNFMTRTVIPLVDFPLPAKGIASLDDAEHVESLIVVETSFARSYFCKVRRLKTPFVAIVSIAVAEYAFMNAGYKAFMLIATWYQKRDRRGNISNIVY